MTTPGSADDGRRQALVQWIAELVGEPDVTITRRSGGGSHEAWDVGSGSGRRWFLRADNGPPGEHQHYTLRREASVYDAIHAAGLPCPEVLGVHPELEAVLLERASGDAAFGGLPAAAQTAIIDDFAPWLAQLHAAEPSRLNLSGLGPVTTIEDHVRQELDIWEQRLDASGAPDPVLTACFIWLRDHLPPTGSARPALVQGDTGPGNFLHDGERVTAFLDFELAHLGDPMEDLAWVGTRNAQEPVPDFDHFLARYAAAAGVEPDRDRIRYHALFAELRIAVLGVGRSAGPADLDAEHGNQLIYGALHRRLMVEALASAMGVDLPAVTLPPLVDTSETRYFDGALHQLRNLIGPQLSDPYVARRMKSMARVLKYLREVDRAGERHVEAELDSLSDLLGHRPDTVAAGSQELLDRVRAREVNAADLLPYAAAQVTRRTQLVGPAMGVLATRHLPVV